MLIDEDQKRWMGVALEAAAQRATLDYGREGPEVERSLKAMAHAIQEDEPLIPRHFLDIERDLCAQTTAGVGTFQFKVPEWESR